MRDGNWSAILAVASCTVMGCIVGDPNRFAPQQQVIVDQGNGSEEDQKNGGWDGGFDLVWNDLAAADFSGVDIGMSDLVVVEMTSDFAANDQAVQDAAVSDQTLMQDLAVNDFTSHDLIQGQDLGTADLVQTDLSSPDLAQIMGLSFSASSVPNIGALPMCLAVGDWNGDGKPDLVTVHSTPQGFVSPFLNNGKGVFTELASVPVGAVPVAAAVADFDLDGRLDLAVTNAQNDNVYFLRGQGNGSFNLLAALGVGKSPHGIAVSYLDGDFRPDFVTANALSHTVSVRLGNNQNVPDVSIGQSVPADVTLADLNKDGHADLAVANVDTNDVWVFYGGGDGTFVFGGGKVIGNKPQHIVAADFNGDNLPDLSITNWADGTVAILLNDGKGWFIWPDPPPTVAVGKNPEAHAAGDFNQDGKTDLVVPNNADNTVSILIGNGDGTFTQPLAPLAAGTGPHQAVVADFNLDGKPDIAVVSEDSTSLTVLLNASK